jgi:hypothetical protein
MTITSHRLALGAISALAVAVSLTPMPRSRATEQEPEPETTTTQSPFDATALGAVLRANGNEIPKSGEDLVRVLHQVGDFAQLPVPFSAVAMTSGLTHPRVILAPRIKGDAHPDNSGPMDPPNAAPTHPSHSGKATTTPTIRPLSTTALNQPNIEGRLFFAANMERTTASDIRVKTVEFISWNSRKKRFDFGVIDYTTTEPEIKFLDGVRCFSCHKNKGPILGSGPWSNTTNNDVVRDAAKLALKLPKRSKPTASEDDTDPTALLKAQTTFDGMSLIVAEPEAVDAAVRLGSDLVRDRAIYRAMLKSADGRKAFGFLLSAIVDPQPIDKSYREIKQSLDLAFNNSYANFGNDVVAINSASSSTLHDYNPSGSIGTLQTTSGKPAGWGRGSTRPANTTVIWSSSTDKVITYDSRRAAGDPAMASPRQPSSPKAFIHPPTTVPARPSATVSAISLARVMGLTEADRAFLSQILADTAQRINKPNKVTAATLAREVFGGPSFADNWKTGDIPDREEFKDRFVAGLTAVANTYQLTEGLKVDRHNYASGPNCMPVPGKEDREPEIVPTTACLRCHDIRGVGKPVFNPIPMLAFDPLDKRSREAWVLNADAKQKQPILDRMLKRLVTDKDMPPEDSLEHDLFRVKEPASFNAVKEFLETELMKLNGN